MNSRSVFLLVLMQITLNGNTNAFTSKFSQIYVTDFHLSKCNPDDSEPITFKDVDVQLDENDKVHVSGTLIASENLIKPITADVVIKRSTWFGWIKIACIDDMGSCRFDDVCEFGYPNSEDCPQQFKVNQIPCRCPIKMGNYTLPPSMLDYMNEKSVLSGKYKGSVVLTHFNETLACYNMYFTLRDRSWL